jgi:hypothetical protein
MTSQLNNQLNMKNEELQAEEFNLKNLKERFDTLRRTGTPFVLHENAGTYGNHGMNSGPQNLVTSIPDYRGRPSDGMQGPTGNIFGPKVVSRQE